MARSNAWTSHWNQWNHRTLRWVVGKCSTVGCVIGWGWNFYKELPCTKKILQVNNFNVQKYINIINPPYSRILCRKKKNDREQMILQKFDQDLDSPPQQYNVAIPVPKKIVGNVSTFPVGFSYEKTPNSVAGWGGGYHHWFSKSRRQSKVNDSISPPKKGL